MGNEFLSHRPLGLGLNGQCLDAVVQVGEGALTLFEEVKGVIAGHLSALEALRSGVKSFIEDIKEAAAACDLDVPAVTVGFNAACISDVESIISGVESLIGTIKQLASGDLSAITALIGEVKALAGDLVQ